MPKKSQGSGFFRHGVYCFRLPLSVSTNTLQFANSRPILLRNTAASAYSVAAAAAAVAARAEDAASVIPVG